METKLEASKREAKKNRQRSQKLQELLKKQREASPEVSDEFEEVNALSVETRNKFSKLCDFPLKHIVSDPKAEPEIKVFYTENKEVQTETPFYPYDCFYCEEILQCKDQLVNHKNVCHGRPWASCQDCSLKFSSLSDLKNHKAKIHDLEKLVTCFEEIFKLPAKNFICRECGDKFELKSELELHVLTSHGAWKEMMDRKNGH